MLCFTVCTQYRCNTQYTAHVPTASRDTIVRTELYRKLIWRTVNKYALPPTSRLRRVETAHGVVMCVLHRRLLLWYCLYAEPSKKSCERVRAVLPSLACAILSVPGKAEEGRYFSKKVTKGPQQ